MKYLIIVALLLTSFKALSDIEISYAPKAAHAFVKGSYINDDIDLIAIKKGRLGLFTMINSYHERSFGIYSDKELWSSNQLSVDLIYGAVYGYRDQYLVNKNRNKIVKKGRIVVKPIIAPSLNYQQNETVRYSFTQYANASVIALKLTF